MILDELWWWGEDELQTTYYNRPKELGDALAWQNAEEGVGVSVLEGDETLRILVHKVNDLTNAVYIRGVR